MAELVQKQKTLKNEEITDIDLNNAEKTETKNQEGFYSSGGQAFIRIR
ncbi:hypothetical protein [Methanosalsum natronophilum]|nr:hypothetical protein [Methanosalsum natronophilum]MCS3923116.1 hypothetical protein [Methanosalsum natronophilum]